MFLFFLVPLPLGSLYGTSERFNLSCFQFRDDLLPLSYFKTKALRHLLAPRHVLARSKSLVFGRREARRKSTFLSANVSGIRHSASRTGVFEETPQKTTAHAAAGVTNGRLAGGLKHFEDYFEKIFLFFVRFTGNNFARFRIGLILIYSDFHREFSGKKSFCGSHIYSALGHKPLISTFVHLKLLRLTYKFEHALVCLNSTLVCNFFV